MARWQIVVAVAAVVLAVVSANTKDIIEGLKKEIKQVSSKTEEVKNQTKAKSIHLESIKEEYKERIYSMNATFENVNEEIKQIMDNMTEIFAELEMFYPIVEEFNATVQRLQIKKKKLEFAIKWLYQDINIYNRRKNDSDDEKCSELKSVIYFATASKRKLHQHLYDPSDDDLIVILSQELRHARTKLSEALALNLEMDSRIEEAIKFGDKKIADFRLIIDSASSDLASAEKAYADLGKKEHAIVEIIRGFESEIESLLDYIENNENELYNIKITLDDFTSAISCYNKTEVYGLERAKPLPIE